MGFTSDEKPAYDLANNGYLPENLEYYSLTGEHWAKYQKLVDRNDGNEDLVYIPIGSQLTDEIILAQYPTGKGRIRHLFEKS